MIEIKDDRTTWKDGVRIPLSPKPTLILELLLALQGQVVSREQIMDKLYGSSVKKPELKILDVYICKIRKAGFLIETTWGRGYSLVQSIEVAA